MMTGETAGVGTVCGGVWTLSGRGSGVPRRRRRRRRRRGRRRRTMMEQLSTFSKRMTSYLGTPLKVTRVMR